MDPEAEVSEDESEEGSGEEEDEAASDNLPLQPKIHLQRIDMLLKILNGEHSGLIPPHIRYHCDLPLLLASLPRFRLYQMSPRSAAAPCEDNEVQFAAPAGQQNAQQNETLQDTAPVGRGTQKARRGRARGVSGRQGSRQMHMAATSHGDRVMGDSVLDLSVSGKPSTAGAEETTAARVDVMNETCMSPCDSTAKKGVDARVCSPPGKTLQDTAPVGRGTQKARRGRARGVSGRQASRQMHMASNSRGERVMGDSVLDLSVSGKPSLACPEETTTTRLNVRCRSATRHVRKPILGTLNVFCDTSSWSGESVISESSNPEITERSPVTKAGRTTRQTTSESVSSLSISAGRKRAQKARRGRPMGQNSREISTQTLMAVAQQRPAVGEVLDLSIPKRRRVLDVPEEEALDLSPMRAAVRSNISLCGDSSSNESVISLCSKHKLPVSWRGDSGKQHFPPAHKGCRGSSIKVSNQKANLISCPSPKTEEILSSVSPAAEKCNPEVDPVEQKIIPGTAESIEEGQSQRLSCSDAQDKSTTRSMSPRVETMSDGKHQSNDQPLASPASESTSISEQLNSLFEPSVMAEPTNSCSVEKKKKKKKKLHQATPKREKKSKTMDRPRHLKIKLKRGKSNGEYATVESAPSGFDPIVPTSSPRVENTVAIAEGNPHGTELKMGIDSLHKETGQEDQSQKSGITEQPMAFEIVAVPFSGILSKTESSHSICAVEEESSDLIGHVESPGEAAEGLLEGIAPEFVDETVINMDSSMETQVESPAIPVTSGCVQEVAEEPADKVTVDAVSKHDLAALPTCSVAVADCMPVMKGQAVNVDTIAARLKPCCQHLWKNVPVIPKTKPSKLKQSKKVATANRSAKETPVDLHELQSDSSGDLSPRVHRPKITKISFSPIMDLVDRSKLPPSKSRKKNKHRKSLSFSDDDSSLVNQTLPSSAATEDGAERDTQATKGSAEHDKQATEDSAEHDKQATEDGAEHDKQATEDGAEHDKQANEDSAEHDKQATEDRAEHDKQATEDGAERNKQGHNKQSEAQNHSKQTQGQKSSHKRHSKHSSTMEGRKEKKKKKDKHKKDSAGFNLANCLFSDKSKQTVEKSKSSSKTKSISKHDSREKIDAKLLESGIRDGAGAKKCLKNYVIKKKDSTSDVTIKYGSPLDVILPFMEAPYGKRPPLLQRSPPAKCSEAPCREYVDTMQEWSTQGYEEEMGKLWNPPPMHMPDDMFSAPESLFEPQMYESSVMEPPMDFPTEGPMMNFSEMTTGLPPDPIFDPMPSSPITSLVAQVSVVPQKSPRRMVVYKNPYDPRINRRAEETINKSELNDKNREGKEDNDDTGVDEDGNDLDHSEDWENVVFGDNRKNEENPWQQWLPKDTSVGKAADLEREEGELSKDEEEMSAAEDLDGEGQFSDDEIASAMTHNLSYEIPAEGDERSCPATPVRIMSPITFYCAPSDDYVQDSPAEIVSECVEQSQSPKSLTQLPQKTVASPTTEDALPSSRTVLREEPSASKYVPVQAVLGDLRHAQAESTSPTGQGKKRTWTINRTSAGDSGKRYKIREENLDESTEDDRAPPFDAIRDRIAELVRDARLSHEKAMQEPGVFLDPAVHQELKQETSVLGSSDSSSGLDGKMANVHWVEEEADAEHYEQLPDETRSPVNEEELMEATSEAPLARVDMSEQDRLTLHGASLGNHTSGDRRHVAIVHSPPLVDNRPSGDWEHVIVVPQESLQSKQSLPSHVMDPEHTADDHSQLDSDHKADKRSVLVIDPSKPHCDLPAEHTHIIEHKAPHPLLSHVGDEAVGLDRDEHEAPHQLVSRVGDDAVGLDRNELEAPHQLVSHVGDDAVGLDRDVHEAPHQLVSRVGDDAVGLDRDEHEAPHQLESRVGDDAARLDRDEEEHSQDMDAAEGAAVEAEDAEASDEDDAISIDAPSDASFLSFEDDLDGQKKSGTPPENTKSPLQIPREKVPATQPAPVEPQTTPGQPVRETYITKNYAIAKQHSVVTSSHSEPPPPLRLVPPEQHHVLDSGPSEPPPPSRLVPSERMSQAASGSGKTATSKGGHQLPPASHVKESVVTVYNRMFLQNHHLTVQQSTVVAQALFSADMKRLRPFIEAVRNNRSDKKLTSWDNRNIAQISYALMLGCRKKEQWAAGFEIIEVLEQQELWLVKLASNSQQRPCEILYRMLHVCIRARRFSEAGKLLIKSQWLTPSPGQLCEKDIRELRLELLTELLEHTMEQISSSDQHRFNLLLAAQLFNSLSCTRKDDLKVISPEAKSNLIDLGQVFNKLMLTAIISKNTSVIRFLYDKNLSSPSQVKLQNPVLSNLLLYVYKAHQEDSTEKQKLQLLRLAGRVARDGTHTGLFAPQAQAAIGQGLTINVNSTMNKQEIHCLLFGLLDKLREKHDQQLEDKEMPPLKPREYSVSIRVSVVPPGGKHEREQAVALIHEVLKKDLQPPVPPISDTTGVSLICLAEAKVRQYVQQHSALIKRLFPGAVNRSQPAPVSSSAEEAQSLQSTDMPVVDEQHGDHRTWGPDQSCTGNEGPTRPQENWAPGQHLLQQHERSGGSLDDRTPHQPFSGPYDGLDGSQESWGAHHNHSQRGPRSRGSRPFSQQPRRARRGHNHWGPSGQRGGSQGSWGPSPHLPQRAMGNHNNRIARGRFTRETLEGNQADWGSEQKFLGRNGRLGEHQGQGNWGPGHQYMGHRGRAGRFQGDWGPVGPLAIPNTGSDGSWRPGWPHAGQAEEPMEMFEPDHLLSQNLTRMPSRGRGRGRGRGRPEKAPGPTPKPDLGQGGSQGQPEQSCRWPGPDFDDRKTMDYREKVAVWMERSNDYVPNPF